MDESIGHAYISTMIETKNKTGLPVDFSVSRIGETASALITSFMEDLFHRRLISFNQLSTDIVGVASFLDSILKKSVSEFDLTLNAHNRHVMIQLIVTYFYKFIGQLSDDHLVQIAYRTVSMIPTIKLELLAFCLSGTQDVPRYDYGSHYVHDPHRVDTRRVISEWRDIINTGFNGVRTIRRLYKLNLPEDDDEVKDGDFIAGLKRQLNTLEKCVENEKREALLYEQEVNKYVSTNCGLNVTANNALIVGKFIHKLLSLVNELVYSNYSFQNWYYAGSIVLENKVGVDEKLIMNGYFMSLLLCRNIDHGK